MNKIFNEYIEKNISNNIVNTTKSIQEKFDIDAESFDKDSKIYNLLKSYDILYTTYNTIISNKYFYRGDNIPNIVLGDLYCSNIIIKLYYLGQYLDIDIDINILQRLCYEKDNHIMIIYYNQNCTNELYKVRKYIHSIKTNEEYINSLL